jgi:hypothetical protein
MSRGPCLSAPLPPKEYPSGDSRICIRTDEDLFGELLQIKSLLQLIDKAFTEPDFSVLPRADEDYLLAASYALATARNMLSKTIDHMVEVSEPERRRNP